MRFKAFTSAALMESTMAVVVAGTFTAAYLGLADPALGHFRVSRVRQRPRHRELLASPGLRRAAQRGGGQPTIRVQGPWSRGTAQFQRRRSRKQDQSRRVRYRLRRHFLQGRVTRRNSWTQAAMRSRIDRGPRTCTDSTALPPYGYRDSIDHDHRATSALTMASCPRSAHARRVTHDGPRFASA